MFVLIRNVDDITHTLMSGKYPMHFNTLDEAELMAKKLNGMLLREVDI
ncbi:hypothetical protein ABC345_20225 [Shouchella sp. 1P09AA]